MIPLLYERVIEDDDDTCYRRFSLRHIHLLTIAMTNIANNPSMFIEDYPDFTPDDIQTLLDKIVENIMVDITTETIWAEEILRMGCDLTPDNSAPALTITANGNQVLGFYAQASTPALGTIYEIESNMRAGTWEYQIMASKANQGAVCKTGFKDVDSNLTYPLGTHSFYNATQLFNQKFTGTFTVPKSGVSTWWIGTDSLGAGAGTNRLYISYVWLRRTGA